MIAQNTMKINGKWFYAGEEIPGVGKSTSVFSNGSVQSEECELPFVSVPDKRYTKTEINRMPTAELKQLAFDEGVENADMMTGAELKKHFISAFGL